MLNRFHILTYFQSEDPDWFLVRAFPFTSRTAHVFIAAVARDYDERQKGLSWLLRGKCLGQGIESFSDDHILVRERIRHKWEQVISTLRITKGTIPRPSSRHILCSASDVHCTLPTIINCKYITFNIYLNLCLIYD